MHLSVEMAGLYGYNIIVFAEMKSVMGPERLKMGRIRVRLAGILVLLSVLAVTVSACGKGKEETPAESTAQFLKNGSITVTSVEPFDESLYSKKELKSLIDTQISETGSGDVVFGSLDVADNVATLVLEYSSSDAFCRFNEGVILFYGTCAEAGGTGLDLSPIYGQPSAVRSSRIMTAGKMTGDLADHKLIYITAPQVLILPEPVLYTTANVRVEDGRRAVLSDKVSGSEPAILILQ